MLPLTLNEGSVALTGVRTAAPVRSRVLSIDSYRGLVMALMLGEVLHSCEVAGAPGAAALWGVVCYEQTHAAWTGCSLHDLIQPGFYLLVGAGVFFSLSRRRDNCVPPWQTAGRVVLRSMALIVLGMLMLAVHPRAWVWWFCDTLTQIGLAYPFLYLIARCSRRMWWVAVGLILISYWLVFALYPVPGPNFDYAAVGVGPEWLRLHGLQGFAAHWQKNSNAAAAFDRWFLNLFPQDAPYVGSSNGLVTLNFIPSIATMVLGVAAADVLRSSRSVWQKERWLIGAGIALSVSGWYVGRLGFAPVVKAIWTPSWVLFSGGLCYGFLAAFTAITEGAGLRRLVFPLVVIGQNSIVAYVLSHVYPAFGYNAIRRVIGERVFDVFGRVYEPAVYGASVFALYWLLLFILYKRRILVRI
jgi:predicted acyltransferase